jgi:hypothetical protein
MSSLNDLRNNGQNNGIIRYLNALEPMLGSSDTIPTVPSAGVSGISTTNTGYTTLKTIRITSDQISKGTLIKVNGIFIETANTGTIDTRIVFKDPKGNFKFTFWDNVGASEAQVVEGWLFIEEKRSNNGIAIIYAPVPPLGAIESPQTASNTLRCTDWKTDSYIDIEWQALTDNGATAYLGNFSVEVLKPT